MAQGGGYQHKCVAITPVCNPRFHPVKVLFSSQWQCILQHMDYNLALLCEVKDHLGAG